jgi:hypothetical protein
MVFPSLLVVPLLCNAIPALDTVPPLPAAANVQFVACTVKLFPLLLQTNPPWLYNTVPRLATTFEPRLAILDSLASFEIAEAVNVTSLFSLYWANPPAIANCPPLTSKSQLFSWKPSLLLVTLDAALPVTKRLSAAA